MFTVIATLVIAVIFLGGVFLNIDIKNSKEELVELREDIDKLKLDIRRQKIEITTLINPGKVFDYIEKKGLQPTSINNVDIIYLKND